MTAKPRVAEHLREKMMSVRVGDKVQTGVYVFGEWKPMYSGFVVAQSFDGSTSDVDIMSHRGGAPWITKERTDRLRLVQIDRTKEPT